MEIATLCDTALICNWIARKYVGVRIVEKMGQSQARPHSDSSIRNSGATLLTRIGRPGRIYWNTLFGTVVSMCGVEIWEMSPMPLFRMQDGNSTL